MSVPQNQIEELRNLFLKDVETKGSGSVHPKDLARVKTSDDWLRRFIMHQEYDTQRALEMLWNSVRWRKENDVNDLDESKVRMDILVMGGFFPHGADIDGCKLLVFKCKKHTKGAIKMEELQKCIIYWFERLERMVQGKMITLFFDMEGCGLSNMDMELIKYLIGLFKEYYPYFLNYILIFEMPWILSTAFKVIKSWLPPKAVEKIKFVSTKDISSYVPVEHALTCWGGNSTYEFKFVPESVPEPAEKTSVSSVACVNNNNNRKQVHFNDGQMSEISLGNGDTTDGGSLKVTPSGIVSFILSGNELVSTLELQNTDPSSHISYKLKTTSPEKFRVKPSMGCLAPGESATVTLTLLPGYQLGGLSRDKFLVMSTPISASEAINVDMAEVWKNTSNRKVNQHRLKCIQSGGATGGAPGELTRNGNLTNASVEQDNSYNKLSATLSKLASCQAELHRSTKLTQYYQLATIFLVLMLGIVLGYVLHANMKELHGHSYCPNDYIGGGGRP
ncbi:unnamed protein product [Acanthoscelides obtectus]|uniref:Motile sperm domain-containing protein 2 n=2 Tax=Acanthoscelides obtectus TaxID=200917 RepID=A0A9P0LQS6_ACAOB|nr:unnamed protein product [Acanthoscelides obtectus]CAK1659286.1 Motile sperm domain-containing protein 2 [Acanthoscelides obtectus]